MTFDRLSGDASLLADTETGSKIEPPGIGAISPINDIAEWAHDALLAELNLTPKPGLVDLRNSGAHRDMNYDTFITSIAAITPYFHEFCRIGMSSSAVPAALFLPLIRPVGIACEKAMFAATGNVNTHKGAIFSMGLFCAAAARLGASGAIPDRKRLCREIAAICASVVANDLERNRSAKTVGERVFREFGLTGIRGEAASGYATVRRHALPAYDLLTAKGYPEQIIRLQVLLSLMANNADTNVIGRSGMKGSSNMRRKAVALLEDGGALGPGGIQRMTAFDDELISLNISPGGSADLLAVCLFLSRFPA